jgi:carbonic anhydrase
MTSHRRYQTGKYHARLTTTLFIGVILLLGSFVAFAVTPKDAMTLLTAGNARFRQGVATHPNSTKARIDETAAGQHPFAVVLTCADSRVPPELIFDRGIGDLFVVRTAGNVIDPIITGSIEYAVEHLHAPQIIVMGHTRCGAVKAAAEHPDAGGAIGSVLKCVSPAIAHTTSANPKLTGDAFLDAAAHTNAQQQATLLCQQSPLIAHAVNTGEVTVTCAMYDVRTGTVTMNTTSVAPADVR